MKDQIGNRKWTTLRIAITFGSVLLLSCGVALSTGANPKPAKQADSSPQEEARPRQYQVRDFSKLKGMEGFSDAMLEDHLSLYQGYVTNTNNLLEKLRNLEEQGQRNTPEFAELNRRLGWEFNGMRLHEYYFENLGGDGEPVENGSLSRRIGQDFGSFEQWKSSFLATGAMRGIGWAVLYKDPMDGRLINFWINEHDKGHPAGAQPILIMDVFEHAYMTDYRLNRASYMDAFFQNIDWKVAENRYERSSEEEGGGSSP